MDLPVGNVTFFGSKEVSWTPLLVTVTFFGSKEVSWISLRHVFAPKEVSWTPLSVTCSFLDQRGQLDLPVG